MESVSVSTELLFAQRSRRVKFKSEYDVDLWLEVRKRWLVFGVLCSVAAAVISPRAGGSGGIFHTEYVRYIPLTYIYYQAGKQADLNVYPRARLVVICLLHAHVVAPALCVLTVEALKGSGLDHRVIKGAMVTSASAGCGWASLAIIPAAPAPVLIAANYAVSLFASPMLMVLMCGRASVPPLGGILSTILISATPFALGVFRQGESNHNQANGTAAKIAALLILYADCCEKLREAEGSLHVSDVMSTFVLVVWWVAMCAGACYLSARCGLLAAGGARLVAVCAVPRCLHTGWEWSAACGGGGLARLPAAFLAPAQALLLAAIAHSDDTPHCDDIQQELLM